MDETAAFPAQIEAEVAHLVAKLTVWARHMAGRLNAEVWLTGSVLHSPTPRDVDVRIVVEDIEFSARYGVPTRECDSTKPRPNGRTYTRCIHWHEDGPSQRWVDDVAKFNSYLAQTLQRNIDVQIVPASEWREPGSHRPVLLAGRSPQWWIFNKYSPDPALTLAAQPPKRARRRRR